MTYFWHLASRPTGLPTLENFALGKMDLPPVDEGMIRVDNRWISVDPFMRGLMNVGETHMPGYQIGQPMGGGAIGQVVESRFPGLAVGDMVSHALGWRAAAVLPGQNAMLIPPDGTPPQSYFGILGVSGFTAWRGLFEVGEIRAGQNLFVSAAAGAVGIAVVQLAKMAGLRVIGSAGGPEKCALVASLGADATIDYKAGVPIADALRAAAPEGIDVYFDNVGGAHLDAALGVARDQARFILCGMIDRYHDDAPTELRNIRRIMRQRIRIEGLRNTDMSAMVPFRAQMREWLAAGTIRSVDTVRHGLDAAPQAFVDLFSGGNMGKMVVAL